MSDLTTAMIRAARKRRAAVPPIGPGDRSAEGQGHTALVTGASSGIGRAFTELLAAKGYDVVVVARRETRLKELEADLGARFGVTVHPFPCDLSDPGAPAGIEEWLRRQGLVIDVLVNNAGYDVHGKYLDHRWEEHADFLRVMGWGVAELTHRLLPPMVDRRWGRIVNITSVGQFFPGGPTIALYIAAKSFVHKFSEGIAGEYADQGVHVTSSVPGGVDTEIFEAAGITDYWERNLPLQLTMLRPETVARQAYDACMAGRRVIVHGLPTKLWVASLTHMPRGLGYRLAQMFEEMQPSPAAHDAKGHQA
jgi:short-subunit dehydrogenase